jgi:hypothetical protein
MPTTREVEAIIRQVAGQYRFSAPDLLVATARAESNLNPAAAGDFSGGRYRSYGPFQEHEAGRGAGLTPEQRQDVRGSTIRAIDECNQVRQRFPSVDPGTWAAKAQRPLDPAGYAAKVNALPTGTRAASAAPSGALQSGDDPAWYREYLAQQGQQAQPAPSATRPVPARPAADEGDPAWYREFVGARQGAGRV